MKEFTDRQRQNVAILRQVLDNIIKDVNKDTWSEYTLKFKEGRLYRVVKQENWLLDNKRS